ncbi:hypothetical protein [Atlantibacter sp.]|uniref:hypothetical protein n=1 Tax=Atlantibacter sp. TaxID=1903473 RepID=UPI0028AD67AB|nr:hypothetical protein [Atlantibacter sp.]
MSYYSYISEKDIRKCQFYVRYMESRESSRIRLRNDFDWDSHSGNVEEICYWINKTLVRHFRENDRDIKWFVSEMDGRCKDEILPAIEFDWIKNDKRICLWLWQREVGYSQRRGDVFPDHRGRFESLVRYFDTLNCGGNRKRERLDNFRRDWQRDGNTPDPFAKEDADTINYLWDYAAKLNNNITRHFSPIADDDKKVCLTGFYDCILDNPEKKELFLRKIKSALSSHKHRKKAGKDCINKKFLLSLENDNKLNKMIASDNSSRDNFMNRLIADEYDRRKNTSRPD